MDNNRFWMYQRVDDRGYLNNAFVVGLEEFMKHAISQQSSLNGTNIQCPCSKCKHIKFWDAEMENIKALHSERSQPTDGSSLPQPVDENKLYYDAVSGRNKRNMVYGIGSTQNIFYETSSNNISKFAIQQPSNQDY
ncbi:hypothetical protein POM88_050237 [Heracleum sosnowskyi]|uniref:Transposase-associated domain-containing protein n=1 Tax=Heracleum sosnowskyi TaxID=360622 RepID=A0AAD8GZX0_9APIA|nr:hypothetical protein POM88_050237 [Heracleum sosnowskyi]